MKDNMLTYRELSYERLVIKNLAKVGDFGRGSVTVHWGCCFYREDGTGPSFPLGRGEKDG